MDLTAAVIGPLRHDPQQLRDAARDLLSQPPFSERAPGPVTDILLRIRSWLADALDAVLGAVSASSAVAWLVVAAATTTLLVLVVRWSRRFTGDVASPAARPSGRTRSAAAWREEAEGHAAAQRWSDAVRAAYAALVAGLVEDGLLDDAGGLTVGEIDRQVSRSAPGRAAAVARAGRIFEDVWYGDRRATRADYEDVAVTPTGHLVAGA